MRGFSVYLTDVAEEQFSYLARMKTSGFSYVFTSLHIPEDEISSYKKQLQMLARQTESLGLKLYADISPKSFKLLNLSDADGKKLKEWGLTGVRMDYGIEAPEIASLAEHVSVLLNASTITESMIKDLKDWDINFSSLAAWHNFYPRPETGLDRQQIIQQNKWLQSENIQTCAFVPGDEKPRGPLYQFLPTLEEHRGAAPFAAALDLWRTCAVNDICIGDSMLSSEEASLFKTYEETNEIPIRSSFFVKDTGISDILRMLHWQRPDPARDVIRSEPSRSFTAKNQIQISPSHSAEPRPVGTITVDNERYGRYHGELQITKKDLPADPNVNVVGRVHPKSHLLLSLIQPGEAFSFV
ncbi:DUF871 domain-containing protein [Marinococcus halophilus]|uniref:Cell surface protein n=1 Tax=Marinococcus halophilus TaxID=1371 RepID=A0A510Y5B3_MARHA|nr:MupG family TIM beta-alpha barrel fold protein [Marinococcus halophilus]OZT80922.1 DUF871 domain-containing protein [Marinococcus halophilus]GEK57981.1 hypothetical protein MHA01_08860 [Marinococcus halophilus]